MGLCGDKIAGISMDGRMTKELVISALKDAICYTKATEGCILHSDRGSRYCSLDYQALAKEHGFIRSMSRKGNCWDNAPISKNISSYLSLIFIQVSFIIFSTSSLITTLRYFVGNIKRYISFDTLRDLCITRKNYEEEIFGHLGIM